MWKFLDARSRLSFVYGLLTLCLNFSRLFCSDGQDSLLRLGIGGSRLGKDRARNSPNAAFHLSESETESLSNVSILYSVSDVITQLFKAVLGISCTFRADSRGTACYTPITILGSTAEPPIARMTSCPAIKNFLAGGSRYRPRASYIKIASISIVECLLSKKSPLVLPNTKSPVCLSGQED
ncbi:uncharacterized protein LOC118645958 isoform X2 [Monomorium pharaonis]|uniref:uncharacterized protein LOC118645958 isoform X1 n=1 Tax=Monomorium pharaonis TaxID=307658 RepID=UPI0017468D88|nr:uncharacterized protein LOC118645958 isoform X1 [Monomorium pharaonis]XP_036143918.1 uncharacterized protein LOC118645958 isoform X2 [Monomorium pharaonis]